MVHQNVLRKDDLAFVYQKKIMKCVMDVMNVKEEEADVSSRLERSNVFEFPSYSYRS